MADGEVAIVIQTERRNRTGLISARFTTMIGGEVYNAREEKDSR